MDAPFCPAAAPADATSLPSATKELSGTPAKFPKTARILRPAEFRHIYDHGFRVSSPLFAAFCYERPADGAGDERQAVDGDQGARIGLTVPKAVGGAVERNRIKRRIRAAFRLHREKLGSRWDLVVNPRRAVLAAPFADIERALTKVIEKCNANSLS
jgi:ribonuclease P protein component